MTIAGRFIVDADVLITAKNLYYAFDLCPGFWESVVHHHLAERVYSIDRVRGELLAGRKTEDLVVWVTDDLPTGFFLDTSADEVTAAYAEVMLWVQRNPQYLDRAKAKFATEADGWLAAYAMVHDAVVVTNEQPRPESRSRVLLPDVCTQFKVTTQGTFSMLRDLHVEFHWAGAG
jgi:predicted nucleic acid-binding protein